MQSQLKGSMSIDGPSNTDNLVSLKALNKGATQILIDQIDLALICNNQLDSHLCGMQLIGGNTIEKPTCESKQMAIILPNRSAHSSELDYILALQRVNHRGVLIMSVPEYHLSPHVAFPLLYSYIREVWLALGQ